MSLDRIRIVLVRARNPNNIGAVARAMHDFGFPNLHLVSDYDVPFQSARSAIDASQVLADAALSATLPEALTGCTLVLGTTAVGERDLQHPLLGLAEAAPRIHAALTAPEARVALLFGSEKTGLSNDELSHCDALVTIPMARHEGLRHPSMNLGQAVAVCLWELIRPGALPPQPTPHPAPTEDLERIFHLLTDVLELSGYTRRHPATADAPHLRRLVHRMALTQPDVQAWLGILRQLLWKLRPSAD